MDVTKHIICELTGYKPVTVDVSQGDRGSRAVSCRLLENGAPWMIPEGATARVAYTLPDGKDGLYDSRPDGTPMWEISKNIVTVELADQLMAQAGMVQMSILIIGPEGGQLATWPIRVMVCADNAARLTVPENLPPYGAGFAGKLFYGGADGTITPLGLGDGVRVETMANGAMVLVGEGSGPSEDILTELRALADRVNAALNSDDATLDQLSEIVAYIKRNKTLIDAITISKVSVADIINNLTTNAANKPLSAAQGVALKALIDDLSSDKLDADRLPDAVSAALAQAKESGEFDGAAGPQGPQGDPGPAGADGPPGDDYVLTDADRQEIAEIAAGLVEVPGGGGAAYTDTVMLDVMLTEEASNVYGEVFDSKYLKEFDEIFLYAELALPKNQESRGSLRFGIMEFETGIWHLCHNMQTWSPTNNMTPSSAATNLPHKVSSRIVRSPLVVSDGISRYYVTHFTHITSDTGSAGSGVKYGYGWITYQDTLQAAAITSTVFGVGSRFVVIGRVHNT